MCAVLKTIASASGCTRTSGTLDRRRRAARGRILRRRRAALPSTTAARAATQPIPNNKRIIHYAGEKITHRESLEREQKYLEKGRIWCFTLNRRWVIDAGVGGNIARFINHSCNPNCWIEVNDGMIWVRASRTLRKGEELTYNYNTSGDAEIPCKCRPGCTHKI